MEHCRIINTLNTVRICGCSSDENAIIVSDISYAASPPNAIILVSNDNWQEAFAATALTHHPINAPILFTPKNYLSSATLSQIYKLNPTGVNGVKVFIIGDISYLIENQLNRLGFETKRIGGYNFYETSFRIAEYLNFPQSIILISGEDYQEGLSVTAYAAHAGSVIVFTNKYELPSITRMIIQMAEEANVYIVGSQDTISANVVEEIRMLDVRFVDRISGANPFEVAVNFAKYRSPDNQFGWGRTYRDGHGFTFISVYRPFDSPASSTFGHLGKHTPILTVEPDRLPEVTMHYIESVKPIPPPEVRPPFMHGWIIGCDDIISYNTQLEIERALSIDVGH